MRGICVRLAGVGVLEDGRNVCTGLKSGFTSVMPFFGTFIFWFLFLFLLTDENLVGVPDGCEFLLSLHLGVDVVGAR